MSLYGCYTALITPMQENGAIDFAAYESLIAWQVEQGVHGIVPCGTTGESPTLSHDEHKQLVELAVKTAGDKIGVMAGTGSNSTQEAIDFIKHAEKTGADAALVVAPYYNKPTQEGLFLHYKAVAEASSLPVYIYNIPGRSVIDVTDETIARLAETCPNIAGVKDATGDLARVSSLRALVGDRLSLFSGEDMTTVGFNAMGGNGVISVTSNILPNEIAEIQNLTREGKFQEALAKHERHIRLHQVMFMESNPVPAKYAASLIGKCSDAVRLPLASASDACRSAMKETLSNLSVEMRNAA